MQTNPAPIDPPTEIDNLAARVLRDGWFKSTVTQMGHEMHSAPENIAKLLGNPVTGRAGQMMEPLIPKEQARANAKSLSVVHGLGSFPMHTDGAHRLQPPRFVVLVCASPGMSPVPTTLVRFRELQVTASERARLEAAPFLVSNGRRSFYSTIWSSSRMFIRYDAGCMMPLGSESEASVKLIAHRASEVGFTLVHWRTGDVLVIDNWTVLHGRGLGVSEASSDRKILRVSVQ
jgi:alpha-ketoglutarate-dependent taurine dioxygenase